MDISYSNAISRGKITCILFKEYLWCYFYCADILHILTVYFSSLEIFYLFSLFFFHSSISKYAVALY